MGGGDEEEEKGARGGLKKRGGVGDVGLGKAAWLGRRGRDTNVEMA